jgi:hypothetical protein
MLLNAKHHAKPTPYAPYTRHLWLQLIGLPDALTSTWRGCGNATTGGGATLKCGVQLDVLTGAITALDLVNGRAADRALPLQQQDLPSGSLLLADRGFYHLERLRHHDQQGVTLSQTWFWHILGATALDGRLWR